MRFPPVYALREFIALLDEDHTLDDFKNRLSRGFGVQIRVDLQVRAEIVIQPEEGRRVFTSNELSDLARAIRLPALT